MKNWFVDWFNSEEYLDVYSHRDSEDARQFIDLLLSKICLKSDAVILDAACGAGRHLIYLAKKGYSVSGFDLSEMLLTKAVEEAANNNLTIDFFNADIRSVVLQKKYDLVLNLFTSFGYFENDEENFLFVKNAFANINFNGYYVLDYFNKKYLVENLVSYSEKSLNQKVITESRKIENDFVYKTISITEYGTSKEFKERVKLYEPEFLIRRFEETGFIIKNIFGDYSGSKFEPNNSSRFILICQKP